MTASVLKYQPAHYSAFSRAVHWLTVVLMVAMFYTGFTGFGKKPGPGGQAGGPPGAAQMQPMPGAPEMPPAAPAMSGTTEGSAPAGAMPREAAPGMVPGAPPSQNPFGKTSLHKAIGLIILLLAASRIVYRLMARDRFPELPDSMPAWQIGAARGVQGLIYLSLVLQPLSGWLGSARAVSVFGLFTLPAVTFIDKTTGSALKYFHTHFDWVFLALIAAHTVGALYHHYVLKDNTLMSMVRGS